MAKLIIAGIPRSGTTWLFRSIVGLNNGKTTPKQSYYNIHGVYVPYIRHKGYDVIKTHLSYKWWTDHLNGKDKVIFLYGDVVESVISTYLNRFEKNHFKNCGYFGDRKNIFKEDFLGYEDLFDSWIEAPVDKIILKYEDFDFDKIKDFIPFEFEFNDFIPRRKSNREQVHRNYIKQIENTYKNLIDKIRKINDFF